MWYRFTRGDAYALPRAKCFWAFSPRVEQKVRNAKPKKHKSKPEEAIVKPEEAIVKPEAAREGKQNKDISLCKGKSVCCLSDCEQNVQL